MWVKRVKKVGDRAHPWFAKVTTQVIYVFFCQIKRYAHHRIMVYTICLVLRILLGREHVSSMLLGPTAMVFIHTIIRVV